MDTAARREEFDDEQFAYLHSSVVHAVDWIGFFALFGTAGILAYKLMNFVPPKQQVLYFFGYREKGMISLWVNLFAGVAYYARVCSHLSGDPNSSTNIVYYKYVDYLVTCPLLTIDLLWTLNLPYKITYAIFVQVAILSGLLATWSPSPGKYMWFTFGCAIFFFTWYNIITKVQVRFIQYFKKKKDVPANKRMSVASKAGLRNKNIRNPLQTALSTYFCIWMAYPVLWILLDTNVIDSITEHCINVVLDVLAKSMYGFALLRFQLLVDKASINMKKLTVTKADLMEEYHEQKKQQRRIEAEREASEESEDEEDEEDEEEERGRRRKKDRSNGNSNAAPAKGQYDAPPQYDMPPQYDVSPHAIGQYDAPPRSKRGQFDSPTGNMSPMQPDQLATPEMMQALLRQFAMSPIQQQAAMGVLQAEQGRNLEALGPLSARETPAVPSVTPRAMLSPGTNPAFSGMAPPTLVAPQYKDHSSFAARPAMIDEEAGAAAAPPWIPVPQANQLSASDSATAGLPAVNWRSAFDHVPPGH